MRVTYEVEDGYVGGSRPIYCTIDDDEILECEDKESMIQFIEDCIQEHYEQHITWWADIETPLEELLSGG